MKLWRDLEIGEKIEVGDRCCGYKNKWFFMDKFQIEMFRNLKGTLIVATSYPFEREVNELNKG